MMSMVQRFASICIAALLVLTMSSNSGIAQDAVPGWHSNLAQAQRLSEESGKPLFIVFRCVR